MKLGVNIDHVATLRQARGGFEPDPVAAAVLATLSGADSIVCHLREDRRHLQDRDLELLRHVVHSRLNMEMAATQEMLEKALMVKPDVCTLVPEKREERTTEGGLDVSVNIAKIRDAVATLNSSGIEVSLFINPQVWNCTPASTLKLGTSKSAIMLWKIYGRRPSPQRNWASS